MKKSYSSIKKIGEIDLGDKIILLYITGKYDPKKSQIPNSLPYDPSRYMHRHRGKGKNG